tara:strand:- start:382 stop:561 length:180 start_codon:yes stop_codon:yes gene_type:complete
MKKILKKVVKWILFGIILPIAIIITVFNVIKGLIFRRNKNNTLELFKKNYKLKVEEDGE